jgi:uncharacterized protein
MTSEATAGGRCPAPIAGLRGWAAWHPVATFLALAYAISWPAWLLVASGYGGGEATMMVAQLGPALAGLATVLLTGASMRGFIRSLVRWRVAPKWYAIAVGLPAALIAAQALLYTLLGNPVEVASLPGRLVNFLPSVVILALIAGLGEEPGWRGFAQPRLQDRYTPVAATLVLGGAWALWHLPLVFVDPRFSHGFASLAPQLLVAVLTMLTIALYAFSYTWLHNRTRSVLLCMLLHGVFNAAIGLFPASLDVLQRWVYVSLLGVQVVTLLAAALVLIVATRGTLGYEEGSDLGRAA